jgi:hypothetical protein
MSCESCGREVKYYGHLHGGVRCANYCKGQGLIVEADSVAEKEKRRMGRPPTGVPTKVAIAFRLDPEVYAFLRSVENGKRTTLVEGAVRGSKEFRAWVKSQKA